ncbi:substrate-binding periplasmic protein [Pseudoalteromonas rubra]|nr:transporter substrate-binding domain-containing protein [Pseudoalteromonas rubra]
MRLPALLLCLFCTGQNPAHTQPLLINSPDWRPYFTYDDTATGYAKELLKYLLEDNGYAYHFVPLPIKRGNQYIKMGKLDVSVLSYRPERVQFVSYADFPLYSVSLRFVSRPEHAHIQHVNDISPLRFEFVRGVSYTKEIRETANALERDVYTSVTLEHALKKIIANRSDITAASTHTLISELKALGYPDTLTIGAYIIQEKAYYIAVSKQSKVLPDPATFFEKMQASLNKARQEGVIGRLSAKYGLNLDNLSH